MKWIIGVLVLLGVAGGIYLQTQPRLDLRCVIAQGYDRLAKRHAGWRCLHHAAARGDVSVVISALRDGVPIDARTDSGGTPLMLAAANGRLPVIQILVMRQAGLDLTDANPGATALYSATRRRHPAAVRALLRLGASVDVPDDNGRTPLLLAATSTDASDTQIAHSLVAAGASVGSRDKAGNNGLLLAARAGNRAMARYLIRLGVPVDGRNGVSTTALFAAIEHNNADMARLLLAAGAAPDLAVRGRVPLQRALHGGNIVIANLLRANGADDYRRYALASAMARGQAALKDGDLAAAIDVFRRAIELAPEHADAYAARAQARVAAGDTDAARQDLKQAVRYDPGHGVYRRRLAQLQLDAGQADAAAHTLRRGIALSPDDATLQSLLANALTQLGQARNADRARQRACALGDGAACAE